MPLAQQPTKVLLAASVSALNVMAHPSTQESTEHSSRHRHNS
jgi:hypothetical protein